jgi:hypothetical protein
MKRKKALIICILALNAQMLSAQDTLLLLNGKEWATPTYREENEKVIFRPARKKGKNLNPLEWVALPNAGTVHPNDLIRGIKK